MKTMMSSEKTEYKTPKEFYERLNKKYRFTFDPCPLNPKFDGLSGKEWGRRNFVFPPYGKEIHKWVIKALNQCSKGKLVVMLLPARTDTSYFHKYILRYAREIWFIRGRLKFSDMKQGAPFPSMIVVFNNYPRGNKIPVKIRSVDTKLTGIRSRKK